MLNLQPRSYKNQKQLEKVTREQKNSIIKYFYTHLSQF